MSSSFALGRAALMALALLPAAMADPVFSPGAGNYTLVGCYAEPDGARALSSIYLNPNQTVETCVNHTEGATFAALEYGDECWYGNTVHRGSQPKPLSECNFPCPGDSSEYCGASNRFLLYSIGGVVPPVDTNTPSQPATINGNWTSHGCMTEATDSRALSAASFASDSMTLESCATFCESYLYFGVEYSRECYCGNSFNNGSIAAPSADCSMVCSGNGLEFCGGGNRLSSYAKI